MNWDKAFQLEKIPSWDDILSFVGESRELLEKLTKDIEILYKASPKIEYSQCSAQPGWNIKFKKGSRALCTLYPMADCFIALIVVGSKEEERVK